MPTQYLQVLAELPRQGNLLEETWLSYLDELAAPVKCIAQEEYWAPDLASAAAWLLRVAHQNADLASKPIDCPVSYLARDCLPSVGSQRNTRSSLRAFPVSRQSSGSGIRWQLRGCMSDFSYGSMQSSASSLSMICRAEITVTTLTA
jgi:hypothetical protein